jgi:YbgC/YbaW family acyl-CoA thioester hydrolase
MTAIARPGGAPHVHEQLMYYEDTDFSGVVYHGNYLRYFERARDDMLGIAALRRAYEAGQALQVQRVAELVFSGAARHSDVLVVETRARREGECGLCFEQSARVRRQGEGAPGEVIVTGRTDCVFVDTRTQAQQPVPQWLDLPLPR